MIGMAADRDPMMMIIVVHGDTRVGRTTALPQEAERRYEDKEYAFHTTFHRSVSAGRAYGAGHFEEGVCAPHQESRRMR